MLRTLLARQLWRAGFEVTESHDGCDAAARLSNGYDIVITDLRMPGRNGNDLLADLRRTGHRMPVILITAFGSQECHEDAERLDAVVLDKPLDLEILVATATRLLGA